MAYQTSTISFGPRFAPRSAPFTFWFIVASVALWFFAFLAPPVAALASSLAVHSEALAQRPWALLTYPLVNVGMQPFFMLMMGFVLWWAGSDVERWWGTTIHAVFVLTVCAVTAVLISLGASALGAAVPIAGAGIALSAVLTIWSLRNLRTPIMLLIVPAYGWVLLVLEILSLWYGFGPVLGLFAVAGGVGLPAAYFYFGHHLHRIFQKTGGKPKPPKPPKPNRRAEAERQSREKRVADIFERSGLRVVDEDDRGKR
ncbi:MAG: rhomboid family intramembrane serine protease [Armatimonadetes bacterium]|nr:rhomboid family intramembrane serine protease [Armatimonadota bacterium]